MASGATSSVTRQSGGWSGSAASASNSSGRTDFSWIITSMPIRAFSTWISIGFLVWSESIPSAR